MELTRRTTGEGGRSTATENRGRAEDLSFWDAVEPFIRACPGPTLTVKALRLVAYQAIRGIPGLEPEDLYRQPSGQGVQALRILDLGGDPMGHLPAGIRPPRTRSGSRADSTPVGILGRFVLEQVRQEPYRKDAHSAAAPAVRGLGYRGPAACVSRPGSVTGGRPRRFLRREAGNCQGLAGLEHGRPGCECSTLFPKPE